MGERTRLGGGARGAQNGAAGFRAGGTGLGPGPGQGEGEDEDDVQSKSKRTLLDASLEWRLIEVIPFNDGSELHEEIVCGGE